MIIDVNKLKQQGKTEESFTFEFVPARQLLDLPEASIEGCVRVNAYVRLSGKDLYSEGEAVFTVKGECSRCLEEAAVEVTVPFEAQFSLLSGADYPIKAGLADLTPAVEEAIITGSPMVIYCKDDCKGFCPNCGVNLNKSKCNCKN